jgi:hypothetical protein
MSVVIGNSPGTHSEVEQPCAKADEEWHPSLLHPTAKMCAGRATSAKSLYL